MGGRERVALSPLVFILDYRVQHRLHSYCILLHCRNTHEPHDFESIPALPSQLRFTPANDKPKRAENGGLSKVGPRQDLAKCRNFLQQRNV